jgi:hypothetical protein
MPLLPASPGLQTNARGPVDGTLTNKASSKQMIMTPRKGARSNAKPVVIDSKKKDAMKKNKGALLLLLLLLLLLFFVAR